MLQATAACKHTVSGTISLPSTGFFSPFPHGTCALSVVKEYLALGDGPPSFPQDNTCPVVLRIVSREAASFRIRDFHPLWLAFPSHSSMKQLGNSPRPSRRPPKQSYNPTYTTPSHYKCTWFRLFPFRSPLLWESNFFLFLRVLRCFSSPRSPPADYGFIRGIPGHYSGRVSPFGDPRIKACLAAPRGLSQLTTSFIIS